MSECTYFIKNLPGLIFPDRQFWRVCVKYKNKNYRIAGYVNYQTAKDKLKELAQFRDSYIINYYCKESNLIK